jgi:hypothetical protein
VLLLSKLNISRLAVSHEAKQKIADEQSQDLQKKLRVSTQLGLLHISVFAKVLAFNTIKNYLLPVKA